MKRKFFAAILATTMMAVSFTVCTTSCSNTAVTGTGNTDQTESTEASASDTTPSDGETDATTTDATSGTDATTSETTAEPAPSTRTINADGWPSFEMPAQDTTYIDKLIDAGIAPEYYRGTYINFTVEESDDKPGDMIIYFVNNNPDPNAKIYDFTDAGDGLSEADAKTVDDLVRESFYCYFDYYENYDGRQAIDLDGDGKITNIEKNICAFFTCGADFRGLMIDQIC